MPGRGAIVVPIFAVALSLWLFRQQIWIVRDVEAPASNEPAAVIEEPLDPFTWWSHLPQEEQEANFWSECEGREAGYRQELASEPDSWKVQAKLGSSLLETNASRLRPAPERYEEGRALVEQALAARPENWRTKLAKVALLLANFNDTSSAEASSLAQAVVTVSQNRHTNLGMGQAFLVDGCALLCRARKSHHRLALDPPGAVYPKDKEPANLAQSFTLAAFKRLVEAGKRLHGSVDHELFERDPTKYGPAAPRRISDETFILAFGPYLPLLQLEAIQKRSGIDFDTLFRAGGCDVFVGRRLNGKVCPPHEPPKKKKKRKKSDEL